MMRLSMPVRKCLFSIRGIPRLMRDPEYRDWIPVCAGMTREETRDPFPPVILNRKRSASDWGSSWIWIPVCAGMTERRRGIHSLPSSSTESEALRIGDPFGLDSRFHGNDKRTGFPLARE